MLAIMSKIIYKDPNRFYVYAFLREDGTPYYIGKGTGDRAWIKSGRQVSPPTDSSRISILTETLTETEAFSEEIRLIQFYGRKDLGTGILRNLTDGGEGASGCIPSAETIAKRSAANTGKKRSPETLAKISGENNHMFGKKQTPEHRAKNSAAHFGKKQTPETLAKMSAAHTGKKQSPETIANKTGEKNPMFGKTGEKNPMYGKVPSEDTKAKRLATRKRNKEAKKILALASDTF